MSLIPLHAAFFREFEPWAEAGMPMPAPESLVAAATAYFDVETALMNENPDRRDVPDVRYPGWLMDVNVDPMVRTTLVGWLEFASGCVTAESKEGRAIIAGLEGQEVQA